MKLRKVMSMALACVMLATTAPTNVLAAEVGTELQSEIPEDGIIRNDETGIPDNSLYVGILWAADSNRDYILTVEEAASLTNLRISMNGISNIKGIEYLKNLTTLDLKCNKIIDVSSLSGLKNLTTLNLSENQITDVSPLLGLKNLMSLNLGANQIADISSLSGLKNLTTLILGANKVTDVSSLSGLNNLTILDLSWSNMTDISEIIGLSNLTNISELYLNNNEITDVSALASLTNLTTLNLNYNQITDISPLADLVLNHNLKDCSLYGNKITNIGNFPESVVYDEEVEIRYLTDADRDRIVELLGLSEYDGKVICMDERRSMDSFNKFYPYVNTGYGYDYNISRNENGELTLGQIQTDCDDDGEFSFCGCYWETNKLTISYENGNVWLFCCGNVESSGLNFKDKVEKTKVVEPFAKKASDGTISKTFERDFETLYAGELGEQDIQSAMDYFGFDSFEGNFAIIPTEGAKYSIDFSKSSYGKDELTSITMYTYLLTRDEEKNLIIEQDNGEIYFFENGKFVGCFCDVFIGEDCSCKFLTNAEHGMDIESCEFYIPAMDENSENAILTSINLHTINQGYIGNSMVYNNEKTLDVCNFTELKEPEDTKEPEKPAITEGWKKDSTGWWYQNADGTYPSNCWKMISGKWYAFDQKGYMREGWFYDGGKWYYLIPGSGAMATGWVQVGGTWYYMNTSGAMTTGWVQVGGTWYYMKSTGAMATGWVQDGSTWYYMKSTGAMATGWVKDGNTWYYLKSSGAMATGWIQDGNTWYYLKSSGAMATNTWIGNYYVNASGAWVA